MTKKNKFLLTAIGATMVATTACLAAALLPKANFRAFGETNIVWKHYAERMPGINPGIKEYWVSCNDDSHQFTVPTEGTIQDATGWDTSLFAADDDRYTYECTHKVADSAVAGMAADTTQQAPGQGFTTVQGKAYSGNGYQGFDVDISGYDYLTFALKTTGSYLMIYGGNSSGSDDPEVGIASNKNFVMWSNTWYYYSLERNASGQWDTYVSHGDFAKRLSASIKMDAQAKNATNLKDLLGVWTWDAKEGDQFYSSAVYGTEKEHHIVWNDSKISPVETGTCSVCGQTVERPRQNAIDFTVNKFGSKLMNGSSDISNWGDGYNGGNKLSVVNATSIAYAYYGWGALDIHLPRIDFTKYAQVSFNLTNTKILGDSGAGTDPSGNPVGFRIGLDSSNLENFASTWENAEMTGGKLTFATLNGKVIAHIKLGFIDKDYLITDSDVINGNSSVVVYIGSYLNNSTEYGLILRDLALTEKPNAEDIHDSSIKEVYLEKQVRRVEQQDAWKSPIGSASNEAGHADYYKINGREAIHFSAHYASDSQEFAYNSGWSEWRFNHVQAGLKSVTLTYLYEDSNTDTSSDGAGQVHTMCQWYGAAYQGRTMTLVADGQWHTVTVTGDAYDINFFVMKIYHFTGDIYISSIIYSANESDIQDASIKEFYTTKQVRRLEQQDVWRNGDSVDEAGHAEYFKSGSRDLIHVSAHYASTDTEFGYNSGWSEWRFAHQKAGLTSVTFTYLYQDNNTDTSDDGSGAVHTMCQWYGAAYQARKMTLVADGMWHRITVSGEVYDINYFVMKIFHFTGDLYISDIVYSMDEADVQDASIKEFFTTKQVRRLEQQDAWKSPIGEASDEAGHKDFIKLDGRETIHVSAHYVSGDAKYDYNNKWSEWRFAHQKAGLTSVTFTYLYEDSNSEVGNDGTSYVHTMAQWYGAAYQGRDMNLIADGEWHTITVTGEAYDINYFVMKIYHFTGDLYISNIIYA